MEDFAVLTDVLKELRRARGQYRPMVSAAEGYAIILEELDELWAEVKAKHPDKALLRKEAVQVAAMAIRFIEDVCDGGWSSENE